jgi:hypothetical protein
MAGNENIGGTLSKGRAIFISYRRDDTEGESGRLYDDLVRAYGDDSVFMDVAGIQPGLDFRKAIDDNVAGCGVLLAIIGPTWATITGHDGTRRLDNPDDYVRLEIASALKRGVPVIPVLVHEAHMPALDQLPDDLKDLRYRNSAELTHARWASDVALLVAALKSYVSAKPAHPEETVHANLPVQLPAPQPVKPAEPEKQSKLGLWIGIGAAAVIAIAVVLFATLHHGSAVQTPASTQTAQASTPAPVPSSSAAPASAPADSGSQPSSSGGESAMLGKWVVAQPIKTDGDDLRQMAISDFGGQIMVSASGKCPNELCRWGERKAKLTDGSIVTETWDLRNTPAEKARSRSVTLSIAPNAEGVVATVHNHWKQNDGSEQDSYVPVQMKKAS